MLITKLLLKIRPRILDSTCGRVSREGELLPISQEHFAMEDSVYGASRPLGVFSRHSGKGVTKSDFQKGRIQCHPRITDELLESFLKVSFSHSGWNS